MNIFDASSLKLNFTSHIYKKYCDSKDPYTAHIYYLIRKSILKFSDPACEMFIHGKKLKMPLSLNLPASISRLPFYDSLPRRLSDYLRKYKKNISVIDIGANIGDSVIAFNGDKTLAVEANHKVCEYLRKNSDSKVTVVECLCSNQNGEGFYQMEEIHSSAAFHAGGSQKMQLRKVDSLVDEYGFNDVDILKTDTDGYDLVVLDGARAVMASSPAVFFECYPLNASYASDCVKFLKSLDMYESLLIYNNEGFLVGRHYISDLRIMEELISYLYVTSNHYDVLLLSNEYMDDFYEKEKSMFLNTRRSTGQPH